MTQHHLYLRSTVYAFLLASLLTGGAVRSRAAAADYVLQISLDGLASVHLQEHLQSAPDQFPTFSRLMEEGAYTFNARCDTDISDTVPNHVCMFTARPVYQPTGAPVETHHGFDLNFPRTDDTIHNSGNTNVPYKASMFDVAHDHGLSTAFSAGKSRLAVCERSYDAIHGALDLVGEDNGRDKIDQSAVENINGSAISNQVSAVLADLAGKSPTRYTFLHLAEPDRTGHATGWGSMAWSNMVREVDAQLGRLLQVIQENPILAGSTAFILTADHGGGGVSPFGHSEAYHPANYTIPFFLWGPGIPAQTDLYTLLLNRKDPGTNRTDYATFPQPLRNGDGGNLALHLLGLPSIPGSFMIPELTGLGVTLSIAREDGHVLVSWPDPDGRFALQQAVQSLSPADWKVVTEGIDVQGDLRIFRLSTLDSSDPVFFRLQGE